MTNLLKAIRYVSARRYRYQPVAKVISALSQAILGMIYVDRMIT